MNKTTIQDLANSLGVSRVTVWKVLNNKPGVSAATRSRVVSAAAEKNFGPFEKNADRREDLLLSAGGGHSANVALVVARPESSQFWMKIINQVAIELSAQRINLIYVYLTIEELENFKLPSIIESGGVEGMIIINAYDERVMRLMASSPIPKVYMDGVSTMPLEELQGDVLLPDGRYSVHQITRHLLTAKRPRLGFVGDVAYAYSNKRRWQGFLDAHYERGLKPDARLCMTGSIGINDYKLAVTRYFEALPLLPDGIVCANDFIAQLVLTELQARNIDVPGRVAVSGYDDNAEFHIDTLTTVHVQNEQIGRRIVRQLLYRIQYPQADYEVVLMHSKALFRATTHIGAED